MSPALRELPNPPDILDSLAGKRFDFELLSQAELAAILEKKISSGRLNRLGQEYLEDAGDLFILRDAPRNRFARSLNLAKSEIRRLLDQKLGRVGYITGGLEGLHLQYLLNGIPDSNLGIRTLVMGMEEDDYTSGKGREPLFSTREKVSLWVQLAPEGSVLFVIPKRPESFPVDEYYDWIAQRLGLYKNKQVIYLGSEDDPPAIKEAHLRRAFSPQHVLQFSLGGKAPLHTSSYLIQSGAGVALK